MNIFTTTAAAALVSVAALSAPAQASVSPVDGTSSTVAFAGVETAAAPGLDAFIDGLKDQRDDGTLNPEDYRKIRKFERSAQVGSVEELIEDLKSKRDDGTLNAQDYFEIRNFQQSAQAGSVEELIEELKSQRDDGTLNAQDHFEIRNFRA